MANEDNVGIFLGKKASAKIFVGVPVSMHKLFKIYLWVSLSDDNFFLFLDCLCRLLLLDLHCIWILNLVLLILLEVVSFHLLLKVIKLFLVKIHSNRVELLDLFDPGKEIFMIVHQSVEYIASNIGLKVIKKLNICCCLLWSPFLVDGLSEFLHNIIPHCEHLCVVWMKCPIVSILIEVKH